jgi:hypothetical protein
LPYGYRHISKEDRTLVLDEAQAAVSQHKNQFPVISAQPVAVVRLISDLRDDD